MKFEVELIFKTGKFNYKERFCDCDSCKGKGEDMK